MDPPYGPAGLTLVRLTADRVVFKRGVSEVALSGTGVAAAAEAVDRLLREGHPPDAVLAALPDPARTGAERILRALDARRMLEAPPSPAVADLDARQLAFYHDFGPRGSAAPDAIAMATVVVLGANAVSRAMSRDLLAAGIGRLVVVADEALGADGVGWPEDPRLDRAAHAGEALRDAALLCAVSDTGEAEALYAANRLALATGRPYLPCWIDGMIAHAGPLTYGFETACLRCYRLRADANDDDRETARAVRRGLSEMPAATRTAAGVVPPMTSSAGALLAMEVLKALSGFAPSDAVGRHIELNLVAFGSHVRRVLKVPRCPDCCDSMRRKPTAMLAGPQIPVPPARPHVHEAP